MKKTMIYLLSVYNHDLMAVKLYSVEELKNYCTWEFTLDEYIESLNAGDIYMESWVTYREIEVQSPKEKFISDFLLVLPNIPKIMGREDVTVFFYAESDELSAFLTDGTRYTKTVDYTFNVQWNLQDLKEMIK